MSILVVIMTLIFFLFLIGYFIRWLFLRLFRTSSQKKNNSNLKRTEEIEKLTKEIKIIDDYLDEIEDIVPPRYLSTLRKERGVKTIRIKDDFEDNPESENYINKNNLIQLQINYIDKYKDSFEVFLMYII